MNLEVRPAETAASHPNRFFLPGILRIGSAYREPHPARDGDLPCKQDDAKSCARGRCDFPQFFFTPRRFSSSALGSSFHVVDYNSTTGAVIRQRTSQGYADNRQVATSYTTDIQT